VRWLPSTALGRFLTLLSGLTTVSCSRSLFGDSGQCCKARQGVLPLLRAVELGRKQNAARNADSAERKSAMVNASSG
jgi:hypothetical protein